MKTFLSALTAISISIFVCIPMLREIFYSWLEGNRIRRQREAGAREFEELGANMGYNVRVVLNGEPDPFSSHWDGGKQ